MIRKLLKNLLGENFTENNAKLATVNFAIVLLMFLLSGIMLFFLPEQISIWLSCIRVHPCNLDQCIYWNI